MEAYESYPLAWLVPVLFPLLPAAVLNLALALSVARRRFCSSRDLHTVSQDADAPVIGVLGFDLVFSLCCIVQCFVNYSNRNYVGDDEACYVQGIYSTFYVAGELPMAVLIFYVTYQKCANSTFWPTGTRWSIFAIYIFAVVCSLLPTFFGGQFLFKKDYCLWDIESNALYAVITAALCVMSFILSLVFWIKSSQTEAFKEARHSQLIMLVMFLILITCWWPMTAISFDAIAHGSLPKDGWAWQWGYGLSAVLIHLRHLLNPIVYGFIWRKWIIQVSTKDTFKEPFCTF